jgi:Tol biopolymer transport system component
MSALRVLAAAAFALVLNGCAAGTGAGPASLGAFTEHADIGETAIDGAVAYDAAAGTYRISASGANIWANTDAFQYVYTQRSGNLHLASDIEWIGQGTDPHRKAGLMIRQNLTPGSPYIDVMVHGDGLTSLQYREVQDGPTYQISSNVSGPRRVRLEYEDGFAYMSVSGPDGALHHAGGNYRLALEGPYYVGLAVSAHNNTLSETAVFSNVEMGAPTLAHIADTGYPAQVEATLEVMEVSNSNRRVVRHFNSKIEAPNWTRDGSSLVYNAGGLIYRIPVAGGEPTVINTGNRTRNNNDHGLSPDGTQLIISDQTEADNISRIYLLPITGSDNPQLIVGHPTARSYWHAWTPDGRTIAYTASRPESGTDDYDIYAKDLAGGAERNLTHTMGLDDGPEYTPDGRYLYFNSTRTGHMQIWRANADGSNPEQVTNDPTYRDWFPHFSPDGRWMAFVSFYADDIPLTDHPPNRSVLLRIMPTDGSAPPRILTRLFGGQGTINVPSWSPDSRSIAFVSYRLVR